MWGEQQELWLSLDDAGSNGRQLAGGSASSSAGQSAPSEKDQRRGSARYDFSVLWSAPTEEDSDDDENNSNSSSGSSAVATPARSGASSGAAVADGGSGVEEGRRGEESGRQAGREQDGGKARGLGPSGGHVVGELRPLDEFSAARQEALDEVRERGVSCRCCGTVRPLDFEGGIFLYGWTPEGIRVCKS